MRSSHTALIALCVLGAAALAPAAPGDCYFSETKRVAVVGNSRVEIRLDPGSTPSCASAAASA